MLERISPAELKQRLDRCEDLVLLDVREPEEMARAGLPGALRIPLGEIPGRIQDLDPEKEIVVFCHYGLRSAQVAIFLAQRDFEHVLNLTGGINAWSLTVDPTVPRY
jgi:rhodanese-related sulfurtransferase